MILYHATMDLDIIEEFTPRIPSDRFEGEEDSTPRICVSSSIEGCLTAAPFGGSKLHENLYLPSNSNRLVRIYEFNTESIEENNIIKPEHLYQNDIVRDAEITGEHWITVPIKPSKTYLIKLTKFYDDYCEDNVAYKYVNKYESGELEDITPYIEGCITVIYEVNYKIIPEKKGVNYYK